MKLKALAPADPAAIKRQAGLAKGRATQQYARGAIHGGQKAAIDAGANRTIGHSFHSHRGTK